MSTLVLSVPQSSSMLGEIAAWSFPAGQTFLHADIAAALQTAGLDVSLALQLSQRNEFIRAVRRLAAGCIVGEVDETDNVTFQLDRPVQAGSLLQYAYQATCRLEVLTGVVSCTDAVLEGLLRQEMASVKNARTLQDVNRLIMRAFDRETRDPLAIVSIKKGSGVYFVYDRWAAFLGKVEQFITALRGDCRRCPIPAGTVQGNAAVASATADAIYDQISEYESDIIRLNTDSSDKAISKAWESVRIASDMIYQRKEFLAVHAARLEDHLAYVEKLLSDKEAEGNRAFLSAPLFAVA